ncbi:MAG: radical SAM protein [candidate division FCPU426 bacterium]
MAGKTEDYFVYYVEVSGLCNYRCPSCPNGNYPRPQAKGYMPLDLYGAILEKIAKTSPGRSTILYLFNWGEPTLHPELPRMIEMARALGLAPHLSSNLGAPKNLREIVRARPASFRISLSGYFQETYAQTHQPGDIEQVKANVRALHSHLDEQRGGFPVEFFYHKYRHNLGRDLLKMKEWAAELRFALTALWAQYMPVEKLLAYYDGNPDPKDRPLLELLAITPEEFRQVSLALRPGHPDCDLRARQMCIDFDGAVSLCCASYDRSNFLAGGYLDCSHEELQQQKYRHPLCARCLREGCDVTYVYGGLKELDALVERKWGSETACPHPSAC